MAFNIETEKPDPNLIKLFGLENNQRKLSLVNDEYGSFENLVKKAKDGEKDAQKLLGTVYSEGLPELQIPKDLEKAIGWLEAAINCDIPSPITIYQLAVLHDLSLTLSHRRRAYELYQRAANMGHVISQFSLGEVFRCGIEGIVNEDLNEAFKWYKKAAGEIKEMGDEYQPYIRGMMRFIGKSSQIKALRTLSKCYEEGDCPEGKPCPLKAFYYLSKAAAEMDDPESQKELGLVYLKGGCGQTKDQQKAEMWLGKASENGDDEAKRVMLKLKEQGAMIGTDSSQPQSDKDDIMDLIKNTLTLSNSPEDTMHPFIIKNPILFQESMFLAYPDSPTAQHYLKAYRYAKEGIELLQQSNFTDRQGVKLLAWGYLYEDSIFQAFPIKQHFKAPLLTLILQKDDPLFFEGLLMLIALTQPFKLYDTIDAKKIMAFKSLIHLIKKAEPNGQPKDADPYQFEKSYSSWLHVLYYLLAFLYTVGECYQFGAEAFQKSLECCPKFFEAKIGIAYCLQNIRSFIKERDTSAAEVKSSSKNEDKYIKIYTNVNTDLIFKTDFLAMSENELLRRERSFYMDFLKEAPLCDKKYPNCCYYLSGSYFIEGDMKEFMRWWNKGQESEAKRLPFLGAVDFPVKNMLKLFSMLPEKGRRTTSECKTQENIQSHCSNKLCKKNNESKTLMNCPCKVAFYCDKDCQREDWKYHKKVCTAKGRQKK
ncbi:uncharacterized protein LOC5520222 [Nematostella vectensis]|uniref:uncharacterized protein LOC5520222 n=1 Tax=Nematostella vectensis TaxID=45351 RepID=UPI00207727C5|nr:uncharacterized protein LOC5520222 [Nematostella vectensis]